MPEMPDIEAYCAALRQRVGGEMLVRVRLTSPFVLRTVEPPLSALDGTTVRDVRRLGKRIVFAGDADLFAVVHLMIAGRFQWRDEPGAEPPKKRGLAAFDFAAGTLILTEAASKKRASLHVVRGESALAEHDPGGVEPLEISRDEFATALLAGNHTLKRALTDPHLFSGIGNAYSDEILHAAQLSPLQRTQNLKPDAIDRLFEATQTTLRIWTDRLVAEALVAFPKKVTAFRPDMAVHGKFDQPCPACGAPVQRISYASNEANYCAPCQTGGKLLADRGLSRLLKGDWPRTLKELETRRADARSIDQPPG